jgi:hypothetical protein
MHFYKTLFSVGALAIAALACNDARAGRSCEAKPLNTQSIDRGLQLAEKTRVTLNASGVTVVILARAGQDLSRYNLRYSHLGIAYKASDGKWLVLHKLNACGSDEASLYRQGLGEFFLDDLFRFEATWVPLKTDVAERVLKHINNPSAAQAMHHQRYNMLAYPWSTKYQQSNQWAMETLAAALDPNVTTRSQAQTWLQAKRYEPSVIRLGPLTRLGGRIGSANIAFDDHPNEKRYSDRIETVTVDSVMAWLQQAGLSGQQLRVTL